VKRVFAALAILCLGAAAHAAIDPDAQALIDAGHWKKLRAVAESRVAANPNDESATFLLAYAKWAFADLDGAQALVEKAISLKSDDPNCYYLSARIYGQRAQKAGVMKGMGLAGKFRKSCEAALAIDPNHIESLLDLMEFYYEAPGIAGGDKKKAAEIVQKVTTLNPARGYMAQADLASRDKKPDWKRIVDLNQKAMDSDPKSYSAKLALAGVFAQDTLKKYDQSEQLARAALALDPGRTGAYSVLAQLCALQDRWSDLDNVLAESEKANPDDLGPYYQAGRVLLLNLKDLPRSERYFRKYLTQEPEGLRPNKASAHWRLGQVLEKEGRKSDAIAELESSLKIQPDYEPAKKDLKRLK